MLPRSCDLWWREDEAGLVAQEWRGRWWLPRRPEEKVGGELRLAPDELALTLDGNLPVEPLPLPSDGRITELFRSVIEPIVLGESRKREKLTLIEAEGDVPTIPGTMTSSRWRPAAVLVGQHVEEGEAITFNGMQFGFDYLRDWARPGTLSHAVTIDEASGQANRVELAAASETIGSSRLRDSTVELIAEPRWAEGGDRGHLEVHVRFRVDVPDGVAWRDAVERWLGPLRNLVSLASVRFVRIDQVELRLAGLDAAHWAEFFVQWTDLSRPSRTERSLIPYDLLFTARDLPGGFSDCVRRWFEIHDRHSAVIELWMSVGYAPFIFSEQRFLALAQATEIYHRIAIGGLPLPREEHRQRVDQVLSGVADPQLVEWARPILREANRPRLSQRLRGMIARLGALGNEIAGRDEDKFVRRVVQTRNYLTHRTEMSPEVLGEPARYWHGQALEWLLRGSLLLDLGFDANDVASRIQRNPRYTWFRSQLLDT